MPKETSVESADSPSGTTRKTATPLVFMRFRPAWAYIDGISSFAVGSSVRLRLVHRS